MLGSLPSGIDTRPSINDLCKEFHINRDVLAILADVPKKTILDMMCYKPVHKEDARKVLEELSILLRMEYTFENVLVVLTGEYHETNTAANQTHN